MTAPDATSAAVPPGAWPSTITADMLTEGVVKLIDVWEDRTAGDTPVTLWHEARPSEGGRQQLVVDRDGSRHDLLPAGFNARSAVHEYGGGAAWPEGGVVWFVNWDDQRIWRLPIDGSAAPAAVTPVALPARSVRYADMRISPDRRWLLAVQERHAPDDPHDVANAIVVIDLEAEPPSTPRIVHDGHDFVMSPRFVAADRVRFVAWNHPNMPWDDTSLMERSFDTSTGEFGPARAVATGASFMQPVGDAVISDRDGVWNLWRIDDDGEEAITSGVDEIGGPAWNFGFRDHGVLGDGRRVWTTGGTLWIEGTPYATGAADLEQLATGDDTVTAIVRRTDQPATIERFEFARDAADRHVGSPVGSTVLVDHAPLPIPPSEIASPRRIEFPTTDGAVAYGWFYEPRNSTHSLSADARPPLIVMIHGGPTSNARPWFSLGYQFWTNRGFAIVDVDHRGSTGYGTDFRNLLDGNWGIVDVADCAAAATWLSEVGLVDRNRMVIRGGSAGGFTVLATLVATDIFAAGACSYGIADLSLLAVDTHKFEARYCDRLIGPWPEARADYDARSPINHLDRFDTPLIVFQGADDRVVPPNQSEVIVEALRAKGVECEYHLFEGEGHGFRRADTIVRQLNAELAFYQRVLGLDRPA